MPALTTLSETSLKERNFIKKQKFSYCPTEDKVQSLTGWILENQLTGVICPNPLENTTSGHFQNDLRYVSVSGATVSGPMDTTPGSSFRERVGSISESSHRLTIHQMPQSGSSLIALCKPFGPPTYRSFVERYYDTTQELDAIKSGWWCKEVEEGGKCTISVKYVPASGNRILKQDVYERRDLSKAEASGIRHELNIEEEVACMYVDRFRMDSRNGSPTWLTFDYIRFYIDGVLHNYQLFALHTECSEKELRRLMAIATSDPNCPAFRPSKIVFVLSKKGLLKEGMIGYTLGHVIRNELLEGLALGIQQHHPALILAWGCRSTPPHTDILSIADYVLSSDWTRNQKLCIIRGLWLDSALKAALADASELCTAVRAKLRSLNVVRGTEHALLRDLPFDVNVFQATLRFDEHGIESMMHDPKLIPQFTQDIFPSPTGEANNQLQFAEYLLKGDSPWPAYCKVLAINRLLAIEPRALRPSYAKELSALRTTVLNQSKVERKPLPDVQFVDAFLEVVCTLAKKEKKRGVRK